MKNTTRWLGCLLGAALLTACASEGDQPEETTAEATDDLITTSWDADGFVAVLEVDENVAASLLPAGVELAPGFPHAVVALAADVAASLVPPNTGFEELMFAVTNVRFSRPNDCAETPDARFTYAAGAMQSNVVVANLVNKPFIEHVRLVSFSRDENSFEYHSPEGGVVLDAANPRPGVAPSPLASQLWQSQLVGMTEDGTFKLRSVSLTMKSTAAVDLNVSMPRPFLGGKLGPLQGQAREAYQIAYRASAELATKTCGHR